MGEVVEDAGFLHSFHASFQFSFELHPYLLVQQRAWWKGKNECSGKGQQEFLSCVTFSVDRHWMTCHPRLRRCLPSLPSSSWVRKPAAFQVQFLQWSKPCAGALQGDLLEKLWFIIPVSLGMVLHRVAQQSVVPQLISCPLLSCGWTKLGCFFCSMVLCLYIKEP